MGLRIFVLDVLGVFGCFGAGMIGKDGSDGCVPPNPCPCRSRAKLLHHKDVGLMNDLLSRDLSSLHGTSSPLQLAIDD